MKDIYDEQIERLRTNPSEINTEWIFGIGLFKPLGGSYKDYDNIGCISQIKYLNNLDEYTNKKFAYINGKPNEDITNEIAEDKRIKGGPYNGASRDELEVYAEWQRKIDLLNQEN